MHAVCLRHDGVVGDVNKDILYPVSYTHLDVYKRQGVSRTDVFFDEAYLKKSRNKLLSVVPEAKDKRVIVYAPTFRGRVAHAEAPTALDIEAVSYTHLVFRIRMVAQ